MSRTPPSPTALRVADLSQNVENAFALRPDAETAKNLAQILELSALRKLSFVGRIVSMGKTDWQIEARLGATVVQPCVVTLEPVTTRIDTNVVRRFIHDFSDPDEPEAEMPDDETSEPLGQWIDPAIVMQEALALAVPDYPRKDDAELGQLVYTKPGEAPMTDEDARPFAGLANLKDQLKKGDT
tara:strand:- start:1740 stop:2291 length:552 start_codon:yes stop_codon:yes gene_type:complete